jgi:hypothetical protein
MKESTFNRAARRSGGERPARFSLPHLSADDLEILRQEAEIRREFGEAGVLRFWQMLPAEDTTPMSGDAPLNYPVIIRGFKRVDNRRAIIFQEHVEIKDPEQVETLALKHMDLLGNSAHMIEFEFPQEPPEDRFFRFGTDPSLITLPLAIELPRNETK